MAETVVVTTANENDSDTKDLADAVTDAVEETSPAETADAVGEASAAVADAVGDAVAETVQTIVAANTVNDSLDNIAVMTRLDELAARIDTLQATPEPAPEPVEVEIEDDEIVPNKKHPWFRNLNEWRGES